MKVHPLAALAFAPRKIVAVACVVVGALLAIALSRSRASEPALLESTYHTPGIILNGRAANLPPGDGLQFTGKVQQTFTQDGSSPHGTYFLTVNGSGVSGADGGMQVFQQATYNTTSGTAQSLAGFFSNTSSISTGSNSMQDYAVFGTASGSGSGSAVLTAYAGFFDNGFLRANGTSLLTDVDASNVLSEGYLQVGTTSDFEGHMFVNSAAPPALSSCGDGTAQIIGDDNAGHVHFGAGATGCTLTFALPWPTRPACVVVNEGGADNTGTYTVSTTQIVYDATALSSIGEMDYICFGIRAAPHFLSDAEILARLTPPPHIVVGFDGKPMIVPPTRAELDALARDVKAYRLAHAVPR